MRTAITLLATVILLAPQGGIAADDPGAANAFTAARAAAAVDAFAVDLYRQLADRSDNLFFSPVSLQLALGMLTAGSRGRTLDELVAACHWPGDPEVVSSGLHGLAAALAPRDDRDLTWEVSNRLWGQCGYPLLPSYREAIARWYHGDYVALDFQADSETARHAINAWIARQTHDRIRDMLPPGAVSADTRLVLTNTVYFLADWQLPFTPSQTEDQPFHRSDGTTATVPLMRLRSRLPHAEFTLEGQPVQVLELPYRDPDYAMDVLLPATPDGLPALEHALTADRLSQWVEGLQEADVTCLLPRFTMNGFLDLRGVLTNLGLETLFSPGADLSGITDRGGLFVTDILHQAFLSVGERGTEAAAATALTLEGAEPLRGNGNTVTFRADHPFLLLLRHRPTGAILFMGRLVDPSA